MIDNIIKDLQERLKYLEERVKTLEKIDEWCGINKFIEEYSDYSEYHLISERDDVFQGHEYATCAFTTLICLKYADNPELKYEDTYDEFKYINDEHKDLYKEAYYDFKLKLYNSNNIYNFYQRILIDYKIDHE